MSPPEPPEPHAPLKPPAAPIGCRRALLRGLAGGTALAASGFAARVLAAPAPAPSRSADAGHFPFGPVTPPRSIAAWPVRTHAGVATDLSALLRGRASAVQLMFTGCSATCPIQGALFSQAQTLLGTRWPAVQFVSLSIDPLSDTPAALAAWLGRLGARAGWLAAVPRMADVERLVAALGKDGQSPPRGNDPHTGQVYIVDPRGALVFRTPSMPPPGQIAEALERVATKG